MTTMASQITSLTVVYSTVYSDADQRKHQSSASLAFVWGIHRDRWIPRTKGQLRGKGFHLMTSSWYNWGAIPWRVQVNPIATNGRRLWSIYKSCLCRSCQSMYEWNVMRPNLLNGSFPWLHSDGIHILKTSQVQLKNIVKIVLRKYKIYIIPQYRDGNGNCNPSK